MKTITTLCFLVLLAHTTLLGQVGVPAWDYSTTANKKSFDEVTEHVTGFNFKENLPASIWKDVDIILLEDNTLKPARRYADVLVPFKERDWKTVIELTSKQREALEDNKALRKLRIPNRKKKGLRIDYDQGNAAKRLGEDLKESEEDALFISPVSTYAFSKLSPGEKLELGTIHMVTDGIKGIRMVRRALDSSFSYSLQTEQLEPLRALNRLKRYKSYGLPARKQCSEVLKNLEDGELDATELQKGFYAAFRYGNKEDYVLPNGRKLGKVHFFVKEEGGAKPAQRTKEQSPKKKEKPEQETAKDTVIVEGDEKPGVVNNYNQTFNITLVEEAEDTVEKETIRKDSVPEKNPWGGQHFVITPHAGFMPATGQDQNTPSFVGGLWAGAFLSDDPDKGLWMNLGLGAGFNYGGFYSKIEKKRPPVGDLRGQGYIERDATFTGWKALVMFRQRERKDFLAWCSLGYDSYKGKENSYEEITDLQGVPKQSIAIEDLDTKRKLPALGFGIGFFPWENIALGAEFGFYVPGDDYKGWHTTRTLQDGSTRTLDSGGGSDFYLSKALFTLSFTL